MAETLGLEEVALHDFRRQAHLYAPPRLISQVDDFVDWWILMQHYSAPTRLLDWSRSPYVALYFAVVSEPTETGIVWIIDGHVVSERLETGALTGVHQEHRILSPTAVSELFLIEPKHQTDRMAAQQTTFTMSAQVRADHGTLIANAVTQEEANASVLLQLIIPAAAKAALLVELHRANLTARSLFPGIDGLGRAVVELVRLHTLFAQSD